MRHPALLVVAFALVTFSCMSAEFPPDRPSIEPKKPPAIPQIAGPSQWGDITQVGRSITITGHEHWRVDKGEIKNDGTLQVIWILNADGKAAPGLYKIKANGHISGLWAWGTEVTEDEDGNLLGLHVPDVLRRVIPVEIQ